MAAPAILVHRPVIDQDGYASARPRRADAPGRAAGHAPGHTQAFEQQQQRPATILAFPQRLAGQFQREDDIADHRGGGAQGWRNAAGLPLPTSTFLAQHIAQERLTEGLTLDPYAGATGAYARTGRVAALAASPLLDLTI